MRDTPKGLRLHIAILGRRNAGKSTLLNALARQPVSIVSETAGTTTDPVEKTMELAPMGPVVLVDTAGLDDVGDLGRQRIERSLAIEARADMAILVTDRDQWGEPERETSERLSRQKMPFVIVRNKMERPGQPIEEWRTKNGLPESAPVFDIAAKSGQGVDQIVAALANMAKDEPDALPLLSDLIPLGGSALLIVPLDTGAPKGRLILPQVQAIRDCLDGQRICIVASEKQAPQAIERMRPDLVVCDSQVSKLAAEITSPKIPFTTFSILMARNKGDLASFAAGAAGLENLKPGDAVLIEEACSHHAQKDDIGRVKIPALLRKKSGGELDIRHHQGKELAEYDPDIKAIVHCGACVITRRQMRARQERAALAGIAMTNYGMAITWAQGILERALGPFPEALQAWRVAKK